ncbi:amino acid ABC transporter permease [Desertimonas flava]|uniref:amino acid ABC transporter permease n=1 Tax=Desertimonas flava TaxID=2064846 RepID=UPI000E345A84|nr:amino acid ABC transporter permease [Desertimonas flava]
MTDAVPQPPRLGGTRTRRQAYERRQRRRATAIAASSTIVVVGLVVLLLPRTSGWQRVRETFFSWPHFRDAVGPIASEFWFDIQIFLVCAPTILIVGLLIASARNARAPALFPIRLFAIVYTDIVRGVPVILWITMLGFGVPGLLQTREWYGRAVIWAGAALVMVYSAYVAEVFRAGIESVHESQRAAARSLGLSAGQTMRSVILPQAIRRVVPPLMNDLVSLQKDVALVSLVGPVEAMRRAGIINARTFNFTPYLVAACFFLCLSVPLTRLTDYLLTKERRRMSGTAVR